MTVTKWRMTLLSVCLGCSGLESATFRSNAQTHDSSASGGATRPSKALSLFLLTLGPETAAWQAQWYGMKQPRQHVRGSLVAQYPAVVMQRVGDSPDFEDSPTLLNRLRRMSPISRLRLLASTLRLTRRVRGCLAGENSEAVQAYWKDDNSTLSRQLATMIAMSPSLQEPSYRPTPWAQTSKANFLLATLRSRLGALRRNVEPPLMDRFSKCADPDVIVEWAKDETALALPTNAPIVIFLHTITGTAAQTRWLMSYASSRGWRSCVFVRRGHSKERLSSPSFNLLGAVEDVELQLDAVRRMYPNAAFLGMVGVSAGSAQLLSYLGRAGAATPIGAACAICPAWDVASAFGMMSKTQPMAERAMLRQIKAQFLKRNRKVLRSWDAAAYDACLSASSLPDLLEAHSPFAMRRHSVTGAEYMTAHDPLKVRHGVNVPVLLVNAEDDFVCPASLAQPDIIANDQPGALLLITRSGSHVAFNEGRLGRKSFHSRISFDFLDAALATARLEEDSVNATTASADHVNIGATQGDYEEVPALTRA